MYVVIVVSRIMLKNLSWKLWCMGGVVLLGIGEGLLCFDVDCRFELIFLILGNNLWWWVLWFLVMVVVMFGFLFFRWLMWWWVFLVCCFLIGKGDGFKDSLDCDCILLFVLV